MREIRRGWLNREANGGRRNIVQGESEPRDVKDRKGKKISRFVICFKFSSLGLGFLSRIIHLDVLEGYYK